MKFCLFVRYIIFYIFHPILMQFVSVNEYVESSQWCQQISSISYKNAKKI